MSGLSGAAVGSPLGVYALESGGAMVGKAPDALVGTTLGWVGAMEGLQAASMTLKHKIKKIRRLLIASCRIIARQSVPKAVKNLSSPNPSGFGEGREGRCRTMRELQSNLCQHTIQVIKNVIIPKTQHPTAMRFKISTSPRVIGSLVKVLTSVQLDHQLQGRCIKVDNVGSNRVLAAKRHTLKTVRPNSSP